MKARLLLLGVVATAAVMTTAFMSRKSAESDARCPDIEVIFARGSGEPTGVGITGQAFIDALHSRTKGKSMSVYPVNYPAVPSFPESVGGIRDASEHVRFMSGVCPKTGLVLGGFSRGAEIIGLATSRELPYELRGLGPIPPDVSGHVKAVVLFGRPSGRFLAELGAPFVMMGGLYAMKTIDLCAHGDPVCSSGTNEDAHGAYPKNGMTNKAADFAARLVEGIESYRETNKLLSG